MTKIKTDLERDQSSNNGSICSSVSSSQIDLTDAIRPSKQSILETVFSESNEDKLSNKNFSVCICWQISQSAILPTKLI